MEKGSKFNLLKLSNFFTSSCKTQNLDDVIDHNIINKNPIFTPQNPIFLQAPLMEENIDNDDFDEDEKYPFRNLFNKPKKVISSSSNYQPCSSSSSSSRLMCKPRCPETFDQMIRENCIISSGGSTFLRRKVAGKYSLLSPSGDFSGRRCPPASPASPLFSKQGKIKDKKKKGKKINSRNNNNNNFMKNGLKSNPFSFSSSNESDDNGYLFSSDGEKEDDEKENMYSSKSISLSSDSGDNQTQAQTQTRTQTRVRSRTRPRRRKMGSRSKEVGVMPLEGKVKDTFAVVKSSSDPYNDFRTSMVEMIIEKQIFGTKELEQLLQCFLSLNSSHHHKVIVEVFNEICDALFSHCS
ncbi:uncharacterized protein LOC141605935 [Silene latifolia]|uniref:uncharacterized protein LOC141605935 n=1 Tax=Silene latifolia TaxID=37657 RepID=UPI003D7785C2